VTGPAAGWASADPADPFHVEMMNRALAAADAAAAADEVPVGAVVYSVSRGAVIATGRNRREELQDPTAHAEILALRAAAAALNSWRLEHCVLYVTLEPCAMCAGATVLARVPAVVYGTPDPKAGACHTLYGITTDPRLNHRCRVVPGVERDRCGVILTRFFAAKRALGKK
jgi:tRNA(adenine34) deaminase